MEQEETTIPRPATTKWRIYSKYRVEWFFDEYILRIHQPNIKIVHTNYGATYFGRKRLID